MLTANWSVVLVLFLPVIPVFSHSSLPTTTPAVVMVRTRIECCDSSECEMHLANSFCTQIDHMTNSVCRKSGLVTTFIDVRKRRGLLSIGSSPESTTEWGDYGTVGVCQCSLGYMLSGGGGRCVLKGTKECCSGVDCLGQYGKNSQCEQSDATDAQCIGFQLLKPRRRRREGDRGNNDSTMTIGDGLGPIEEQSTPAGVCSCLPGFVLSERGCFQNQAVPIENARVDRNCYSFTCRDENHCGFHVKIGGNVCVTNVTNQCHVSRVCKDEGHTFTFSCTDECRQADGIQMPNCNTATCDGTLCNNRTALVEPFPCHSGTERLEIKYHVVLLYGTIIMLYYL